MEAVVERIATLEEQAAALKSEIDAAQAEFEAAAFQADNGAPGADAKRVSAEKRIQAAEAKAREVAAILKGARASHSQALAAREAARLAEAWVKTEKLGSEVTALAAEIEDHAGHAVEKLIKLQRLAQDTFFSAPVDGNSLAHSHLRGAQIERYFRVELRRRGLKWAHSVFGSDLGLPSFSQSMADAVVMLLQQKPEGLKATEAKSAPVTSGRKVERASDALFS